MQNLYIGKNWYNVKKSVEELTELFDVSERAEISQMCREENGIGKIKNLQSAANEEFKKIWADESADYDEKIRLERRREVLSMLLRRMKLDKNLLEKEIVEIQKNVFGAIVRENESFIEFAEIYNHNLARFDIKAGDRLQMIEETIGGEFTQFNFVKPNTETGKEDFIEAEYVTFWKKKNPQEQDWETLEHYGIPEENLLGGL